MVKTETLVSKQQIVDKFKQVLDHHESALSHIRKVNFKHDSLKEIKEDFIQELESIIEDINLDYRTVRDEIVWDHLVIGFFGETNAGKSTIIETLRLRYAYDRSASWKHGEIVGTGESDYTKDATEYELNIGGHRVTLIDIPGIEGDESKYKHIIAKALRRAHYVFYVHKNAKRPDTKIAGRIKDYLSEWTRVCSIYNVSNAIGNYDEEEDRQTLLTSEVKTQSEEIKKAFNSILGKLYWDNITLQGQVALCSSSDFAEVKKLSTDAAKLRKFFKSDKAAYDFSRFESLITLLERLDVSFADVIIDSQNQKLRALKHRSRKKLEAFEKKHRNRLDQLESRLFSMVSDVKTKVQTSKNVIKNRCESLVDVCFSQVIWRVNSVIDSDKNNRKQLKAKITRILDDELNCKVYRDVEREARSIVSGMSKDIKKRICDIKGLNISIPNVSISLNFNHTVDVDQIVEELEVSLGDILDVGSGAAGGAAIGAFFGPIGAGIGAAVGAGAAVVKKVCFEDGGVGKAKAAASDELRVCKVEMLADLHDEIRDFNQDLSTYQRKLVRSIEKEIENLKKMKNEREEIYQLI